MSDIEIKNLIKDFNGLRAVNNISFEVKEGEIFGLLGPKLKNKLKPSVSEAWRKYAQEK